jgi:hypothetical protein
MKFNIISYLLSAVAMSMEINFQAIARWLLPDGTIRELSGLIGQCVIFEGSPQISELANITANVGVSYYDDESCKKGNVITVQIDVGPVPQNAAGRPIKAVDYFFTTE